MYIAMRRFPESPAQFFEVLYAPESSYRLLWRCTSNSIEDAFGKSHTFPAGFPVLPCTIHIHADEMSRRWVQDTVLAAFVAHLDQVLTRLSPIPDSEPSLITETEDTLRRLMKDANRLRYVDVPTPSLRARVSWMPPDHLQHAETRQGHLELLAGPHDAPIGGWMFQETARGAGWIHLEHDRREPVPIPQALYTEIETLPWSLMGIGGGDVEETSPTPAPDPVRCSDALRDWCLATLVWEEGPAYEDVR